MAFVRRNDAFPGVRPQPEDATKGGARAVRQKLAGSLEVGKKADLMVPDTQRARLVPAMRILSAWIHNGQPSDIESVMVDGQFIMRNGKVLTMDEDSIIAEANRVGRPVWSKVLRASPVAVPGPALTTTPIRRPSTPANELSPGASDGPLPLTTARLRRIVRRDEREDERSISPFRSLFRSQPHDSGFSGAGASGAAEG
jgi:hypothetical protein